MQRWSGISRESEVESRLYHYIYSVLEKRGFVIEGVRFEEPKTQYPVDGRRADIAVILADAKKPLLIIETKREYVREGRYRAVRTFMPTSSTVIEQALWYAVHSGAPYFATTNGRILALFRTPSPGEKFSFYTHRVLLKDGITISEELAEEILVTVARLYRRAPVAITPLDWSFIVKLRDFVGWLSEVIEPLVGERLRADEDFRRLYEEFASEVGYRPDASQLAREMAYIFMNKIVFYKVLERHYGELGGRRLRYIGAPDARSYLETLQRYFARAVEITGNFEPVFFTGIYDQIVLPDDPMVLEEVDSFIEDMDRYKLEELSSDVVGFVYEELIPAEERHALGQFYTPPAIAELIVKWAVRSPEDKVLDPGCGSGTFLVKAYKRLLELKGYKEPDEKVHREILSQLYGFDINPFPLHLTALNLASRYIKAPSADVNTVLTDFFRVRAGQVVFTPYVVRTPAGERRREMVIPKFDAVVANPPYTRWTEIPEGIRRAIRDAIGNLLTKYNLTAQVQRGVEPGVYIHFVMHSLSMLKEGGRLGMIISDSWLQTDYGINFGNFLLDHFKIKAIIDISARVFPVPLIGACIILLEKCSNEEERNANRAVFIYLDLERGGELRVDEVLDAIENPEKYEGRYYIRVVKQGDIPRDRKWINLIFDADAILSELRKRTIRLGDLFDVSRGNSVWSIWAIKHGRRPDLGAKEFFYLNERDVQNYGLKDYAYPALTNARYAKWFTFTKEDWEKLKERGAECYLFICHKPREELPANVLDYIRWGETECRTTIRGTRGGGRICSQALACQAREERRDLFYGWYDLGGVKEAPIMAIRQSRYKTRFILTKYPVVTYDAILTFIPKIEVNELQLKALLAYLNSSFSQLYIESVGRTTGAVGPIALEVKHAEEMPILDVRRLDRKDLEFLASLFDELEAEARKLGGADTAENVEKLWDTVIERIDAEIARILGLPVEMARIAKMLAKTMMRRRLQRAEEARPGAIRGEEELQMRPPRERDTTLLEYL
ncbi:MAG: N-6 DNA methylase [Thermofilaceae archaeon]